MRERGEKKRKNIWIALTWATSVVIVRKETISSKWTLMVRLSGQGSVLKIIFNDI